MQVTNRNKLLSWEERLSQAKSLWQRECEEAQRKASIAEQQRDEVSYHIALQTAEALMLKAVQTYLFCYFTCVLIVFSIKSPSSI